MKYLRIAEETLQMFFKDVNFVNDGSRKRHIVLTKTAAANSLFKMLGPVQIGKLLNVNHATVLYYFKTHESRLFYSDYRFLYEKAMHANNVCSEKYKYGDLTSAETLKSKLQGVISELDLSNPNAIHEVLDYVGEYEKELVVNFASMFISKEIAERNYNLVFK